LVAVVENGIRHFSFLVRESAGKSHHRRSLV
jgi:hypothetical protein